MSYKLRILKNLNITDYCSYEELYDKCNPRNPEKFSLDVDELGADRFIDGKKENGKVYLQLHVFSSVRRFKRVRRHNIIKTISFAISVIMLVISAAALLFQVMTQ